MTTHQLSLNCHAIVRALAIIIFLLLAASIGVQIRKYLLGYDHPYKLFDLFYVNRENNLPTFFSSVQLLLASTLLAVITVLKRQSHDSRWHQWAILSVTLLYVATDEAASIHEFLYKPVDSILGQHPNGIFYESWAIGGLVIVLFFILSYINFFLHLPTQTQQQFFIAAAIFLSGALGVELMSGSFVESHGEENFQYSLYTTVEEGLEMLGVLILINALLTYISHQYKEIKCSLHNS